MRVCVIGKYPPIQGGVSSQIYWTAHELAIRGHQVDIVTNASEVEMGCRHYMLPEDKDRLEALYPSGLVRYHTTQPLGRYSHIPWSNPYGSKLFGLGLSVIEKYSCDAIIGWYFEPYGLVAAQLSQVTNLPLALRHAGSDIGRLAQHPDLRLAFRWMLKQATQITTGRRGINHLLIELGAQEEKLLYLEPARLPQQFATRTALDVTKIQEGLEEWYNALPIPEEVRRGMATLYNKPFATGRPVIGLYGKVGEVKGSYDLIDALARLTRQGLEFSFVSLTGGSYPSLSRYYRLLLAQPELMLRSWVLPLLPPWVVPDFLGLCDIVCFLERDFPIAFHTPRVPKEILASGRVLVCSGEIAAKQPFNENLVDRRNYILIPDPKDAEYLASRLAELIDQCELRRSIAWHGKQLIEAWEKGLPEVSPFVSAVETFLD